MTASETTTARMIGLGNGDSSQSYIDIEYAFKLGGGGSLDVWEAGNLIGSVGAYATGDVLRVAIEGGVVKYRKNGTLLYTSTVAPTYPLLVDTSLYSSGSTITNVVISSGSGGGSSTTTINWLVSDHLGTLRFIVDQTGSLYVQSCPCKDFIRILPVHRHTASSEVLSPAPRHRNLYLQSGTVPESRYPHQLMFELLECLSEETLMRPRSNGNCLISDWI